VCGFHGFKQGCPKDSYPLAKIDNFVDATAGHALLSFMTLSPAITKYPFAQMIKKRLHSSRTDAYTAIR